MTIEDADYIAWEAIARPHRIPNNESHDPVAEVDRAIVAAGGPRYLVFSLIHHANVLVKLLADARGTAPLDLLSELQSNNTMEYLDMELDEEGKEDDR